MSFIHERWFKILVVVMVIQGVLACVKIFMQWQWDHTVAPFCWKDPLFHTPYLDDWISWLPPRGWKTGVYVYNFLNASEYLLTIVMFLIPPIVVFALRKKL